MRTMAHRHQHTRSVPVGPLFLLIGTLWLSGCAQQVKVAGAWSDEVPRNQSFTRVLVVGVSPNVNQRCSFEFFMASQLRSESTEAIRSCDAVTKKDPLTLESIEQAVASARADAVLATILVSREFSTEEGGSRDTRGGAYYKATDAGYATGYYGVYGVPVIYGEFQTAPSVTTAKGGARIESKLYETRGKTLVYTLDTQARGMEARDAALHDVAAGIADRLRRDGLVR